MWDDAAVARLLFVLRGGSGSTSGGSGSGSGGSTSSGGSSSSGGGSSGSFGGDGGPTTGGFDASLDSGCATATATATRQPVYMLFIQDGSGSMRQNSKWIAVVPALESIFDDMNKQADPGVGAGLIVFSDSQDFTFGMGPYPQMVDVPIGFVGAAQDGALHQRLSGQPGFSTPTQAALTGAYSELENFTPLTPLPPNGKKVVILITDGVPTDGCAQMGGSYPSNPCIQMAAMKLAEAAPKGPILTYVIGVGVYPSSDLTNFDPSFLGNLAQAGGTAPMGCNPNENAAGATDLCYFQVDPTQASNAMQLQQKFEDAINSIRGQVLSCTFPLQTTGVGMVDPGKVNVEVNGTTVPQDPANGWTYDNPTNPTSITLNGSSCASLKADPHATVQIVLGCTTVIPK
jgi:hypothetical protein